MKNKLTLLLVLIGLNLYAQQPYSRITFKANPYEMQMLRYQGLALDHLHISPEGYTGEFSNEETAILLNLIEDAEIVVPDVEKWYKDKLATGTVSSRSQDAPALFRYGQMGGYLYLDEANALIDTMIMDYPDLVSVKDTIGYSVEGRPIYAIKISHNPNVKETEAEVLYTALHHAREPMTLMQMIYFMAYVLEEYGTNAEITQVVNNSELYFVPCVNPDGYEYNALMAPDGGGMWRKNRSENYDGSFGVDLNRNYEYAWGLDDAGSSPDPYWETYRGEEPFSEPETRAIRDFCIAHRFRAALNYHSFGNKLIYPWGYGYGELTPDSAIFHQFADTLTVENFYTKGTCFEVLSYTANGNSDDWFYGDTISKNKIFAFTPEVGDQADYFWPPQSQILPYCEQNLRQNINLARIGIGLGPLTGIADHTHQQFSVYPNPGNGFFQISGMPGTADVEVYDATGRLAARQKYYGTTLDLRQLEDGLYMLRILDKGSVTTLKLILSR